MRGALIAVSAWGISLPVCAAPVSPEAAMQEAAEFLRHPAEGRKGAPASPALSLAYTGGGENPGFYIFNHADGFVII